MRIPNYLEGEERLQVKLGTNLDSRRIVTHPIPKNQSKTHQAVEHMPSWRGSFGGTRFGVHDATPL